MIGLPRLRAIVLELQRAVKAHQSNQMQKYTKLFKQEINTLKHRQQK